jgi:hypothetical protein
MSAMSEEDGRLITVRMIVAGLGSAALFAVALFSFCVTPETPHFGRWCIYRVRGENGRVRA